MTGQFDPKFNKIDALSVWDENCQKRSFLFAAVTNHTRPSEQIIPDQKYGFSGRPLADRSLSYQVGWLVVRGLLVGRTPSPPPPPS